MDSERRYLDIWILDSGGIEWEGRLSGLRENDDSIP